MKARGIAAGLSAAAMLLWSPAIAAGQVRVGAVAGYSLLEHRDDSLSHGPLQDEVTVGRTWLVGAMVDAMFTEHDSLSLEVVYGPYHNDVDRYCIERFTGTSTTCEPAIGAASDHAIHFGLQYARRFGRGPWRPYLGGGIGVKRYAFKEDFPEPRMSPTFAVSGGAEVATRIPLRIELRGILVQDNQLLNDKRQFELQARLVVLLF